MSGPATGITVCAVLAAVLLLGAAALRWWFLYVYVQPQPGLTELTSRSSSDVGGTVAYTNLFMMIAVLLCNTVIGITFLVWLHRARLNVNGIPGADPQWSPGWAVGAWFIPLASFVIGPMVVGDVSRATSAGRPGRVPAGLLVACWMLLWTPGLAAAAVGSVAQARVQDQQMLHAVLPGLVAALLALLCLVGAVRSVTRVQRELLGA